MDKPLDLTYHGVPRSDWSEDLIRARVGRLERYCDHIVSARVSVEQPHRHHHKGRAFRVGVELHLPHTPALMVVEEPVSVEQEANLQAVIDDAFDAMERRLQDRVGQSTRDVLRPAPGESRGLVMRLFADEGYGFLRTPDGEEVYFHANAVLHGGFRRLAVGTEVRFEPGEGEAGPQASSVQIVNKPGVRESEATRARDDVPAGWRNLEE